MAELGLWSRWKNRVEARKQSTKYAKTHTKSLLSQLTKSDPSRVPLNRAPKEGLDGQAIEHTQFALESVLHWKVRRINDAAIRGL